MFGDKPEEIFYYLTLYNEPYAQPAEPDGVDVEGILAGIHRYSPAAEGDGARAQILASGVSVQWALEAQRLLQTDWNVQADVWSVTSWNELRRDGLATDEHNFINPDGEQRVPYLTKALDGAPGPFSSLGTDGFGLSDTRGALRRHFKVDAASIAVKVLGELAKHGDIKPEAMREAIDRYQLSDVNAAPTAKTEGGAE
jgi:pyruvate dehydrogenase E1 component